MIGALNKFITTLVLFFVCLQKVEHRKLNLTTLEKGVVISFKCICRGNALHLFLIRSATLGRLGANRLLNDPTYDPVPRQFIFAAKAAPGYYMAKLIIRLIHGIADVVNSNPKTRGRLSVAFLPDYRVSLAEKIMPASEVSEQISLAGMEASGTGNMKFMMNGALTLGTLDGANVEIHEEVGDDNMFLFGLKAEEVAKLRPTYRSKDFYENDPEIKMALDMIKSNAFSVLEPGLFDPIVRNLLEYNDYYMLLADLRSYSDAQDRVDATYRDAKKWNRMSLVNIARSGLFSSDRAVQEYCDEIWHIKPVQFA